MKVIGSLPLPLPELQWFFVGLPPSSSSNQPKAGAAATPAAMAHAARTLLSLRANIEPSYLLPVRRRPRLHGHAARAAATRAGGGQTRRARSRRSRDGGRRVLLSGSRASL